MKNLLKDKRNILYIIAMLTGVAAIIIGIWFLNRQFYGSASLDEIKFGADFYTEIYNANRRIYGMLSHINDFIEYVKKGFGFTFILGGVVDICVFAGKLNFCKPESPAGDEEPNLMPQETETINTDGANSEIEPIG